ncbi:MAG: glycosyltransferase [bacterium]|nr:glycosyltransferase [bacterium]
MTGIGISGDIMYVLIFIALYFEVFMLVSFLEKRSGRIAARQADASAVFTPRTCIVVPCFNEKLSLSTTLDSILALNYPRDMLEIIVVDDGSTDKTLAIARQYESNEQVRIFHKENGGKHSALNLALAHTDAELIGCLDADSTVDSEALMRIVSAFRNQEISAVTPGIHVKKPENALQHLQNAEYNFSVFNRFMLAALGSVFITPGSFSIYRAQVVRDLGGWRHGHFTEDMELALRMQTNGHKIANAPAAAVYTATPKTLAALFRQRVRWTYGFLRNIADYRFMFGNRAYGNLGLIILPTALISIGTGIYFFLRIIWDAFNGLSNLLERIQVTGSFPRPSFDLYFVNTSALWFLTYIAIILVLVLISAGSWISTGRRMPPSGTPLFIVFYGFLVPFWISTAVFRALFKTGVKWR